MFIGNVVQNLLDISFTINEFYLYQYVDSFESDWFKLGKKGEVL